MHNPTIRARDRFKFLPACRRATSGLISSLLFAVAVFGGAGALFGLALSS